VKKLFELEVPEIRDGILTLKSVAREPGARTKIAVHSSEANVDPVGACVGQRGQRVQAVVDELSGEKIDIIHWNEDPTEFIKQSLSPAKVSNVILNTEDRSAIVIVAEDQQSLAIGRLGQNVRLAARLTSWRIDIRTQDKYEKELREKESGPVILASNEALSADALSVEDEAPAQDEVTQAEGTEAIESSLDPVGTAAVSVNGSMEEDDDAVEQTPQQEAVLVEQVSTAEEVKGASPDAGYQSEAAEDPLRETDPSADR
jgi:N utilization substance protein A